MFYPTKLGNDDFLDVSLFIRKLAYSLYHRQERQERREAGMAPWSFRIKLKNLDRFIKRNDEDFSIDGSNPPESLRSESREKQHEQAHLIRTMHSGEHHNYSDD